MRIIAFAGPSLPPEDRAAFFGIDWRPPCEAGDLLRLDADRHASICVIDGWFDHRPALRHKEILDLLSRGVRVLGASSIGALRAAEMAPFGMEGVGAIFRAYAAGRLTGDDEVALIHGPADRGWRPLSAPLVEIRATLHRTLRARAIGRGEVEALLESARRLHYVDRTWRGIIAGADLTRAATEACEAECAAHAVPLKRIDARACLTAALHPPPHRRPVPPVRTVFLEALATARGVRLPPL